MNDIDVIMDMLDWNQSEDIQQKGIELAKRIKNINAFVFPKMPNKNVWENCAKILSYKSDFELEPFIIHLLEWLEDENWPGSLIILSRLRLFTNVKTLAFCIQGRVKIASFLGNRSWLRNMAELLENHALADALSKDCLLELRKYKSE